MPPEESTNSLVMVVATVTTLEPAMADIVMPAKTAPEDASMVVSSVCTTMSPVSSVSILKLPSASVRTLSLSTPAVQTPSPSTSMNTSALSSKPLDTTPVVPVVLQPARPVANKLSNIGVACFLTLLFVFFTAGYLRFYSFDILSSQI